MALTKEKFISGLKSKGYSDTAINKAISSLNSGLDVSSIIAGLKESKTGTNYTNTPVTANKDVSSNYGSNENADVGTVSPISSGSRGEDEWDYNADINTNKDRAKQMLSNIKNYATTNAQLWNDRDAYNKFFNYDNRSDSQKKMLDWSFDNYNKFGLSASENKAADDASEIATEKGNQLVSLAEQNLADKKANLDAVVSKLEPKYQNLFKAMEQQASKIKEDYSNYADLANQYYTDLTAMTDQQKAGTAAGVASKMSAQGLGGTAIQSAVTGVGNQFAVRYNENLDNHLSRLKALTDGLTSQLSSIWTTQTNLTDSEKALLKDYADGLNGYIDSVNTAKTNLVNSQYAPYETISGQDVSNISEASGAAAKKSAVNSEYVNATRGSAQRQAYIRDYIKSYFGDDANVSDYINYIKAASMEDDLGSAMQYLENAKAAASKSNSNNGNGNTKFDDDEWIKNNPDGTYEDYTKAGGEMTEAEFAEKFYLM